VLGTIKDPSGGAIAKAAVTLTNQGTAIEAKATTDENGNYDFFNVKEGRYTVTVEATGFAKTSTADVDVTVGARQRVDLSLQVGNVSQSVEVSGAASLVETDNSQHGQVIQTQAIVELPLNGRHYSDLALLATNVHVSPIAISFSPSGTPREGAFNVNGMRSTYNNLLRHQQPELFEPGRTALARRRRRVRPHHQQLQRGVRPRRRWHRECCHALRNQPVPRHPL
jgi:hypothetical protein